VSELSGSVIAIAAVVIVVVGVALSWYVGNRFERHVESYTFENAPPHVKAGFRRGLKSMRRSMNSMIDEFEEELGDDDADQV
jgi:hypothetical protein